MDNSLDQIAAQIRNAIYAGLKAPQNYSISIDQIKDEFAQARNRSITELIANGQFDPEPFYQNIDKLPVEKKDFSGVPGYNSGRKEYWAQIPEVLHLKEVNPVGAITVMGRVYPFKVVFGNDIYNIQYDRYSAKAPTVWIQDKNLWLLNPPIANIQHISPRLILENPRAINGIAGMKFMDNDPYPCPTFLVDLIRSRMVFDYIKQYRLANPQPTLIAADLSATESKNSK